MKKVELMIIDDEPINLSILNGLLSPVYLVRAFRSGLDAFHSLGTVSHPELVLCDVNMPEMSGFAFADKVRSSKLFREIPIIFITSLDTSIDEEAGFKHGAVDYITKPFTPSVVMARVEAHLELKTARDRLKNQNVWLEKEVQNRIKENQIILDATIGVVTQLVETRDIDTGDHIYRTKAYYEVIAKRIQWLMASQTPLSDKYVDTIIKASPLHDIGKVGVPDQILLKNGKLTDEEFEIMKTHTTIGGQSLRLAIERSDIEHSVSASGIDESQLFFQEAMNIAEFHHEKWDGTGYPKGLIGEAIPLSARIMALVDVFDALTNKRIYKPAWSFEETVIYIQNKRGSQFDPMIVDAFLDQIDRFKLIWRTSSNL
jgi:putative two-component system response regulator